MPPAPNATPRLRALPLLLLLVALQWLLVANPGYFSHDELQWGAHANVAHWRDLPWVSWTDVGTFQWRPLTFNLWLLLSHLSFDWPQAMHLAWVLMGSAVALALGGLLLRLGASTTVARTATGLFVLGPYAAYVHGWVGTLADLLWVGLAVALAHALLTLRARAATPLLTAAVAFGLTALALLAKEAALAIPALLAWVWWLGRHGPVRLAAVVGSGLAAVVYLALRLDTLMTPAEATTYAVSPLSAPRNWATYWLFPLRPTAFEASATWYASARHLVLSAGLMLALVALIARRAPRRALALLVGASLALAPALALGFAANQYGYGFWAWVVACLALAWPALGRGGRLLLLLLALVSSWHGINVQREMQGVGERQAVFQPALVAALAGHAGELRLLTPDRDEWIYLRLSHEVPAWRGQPIGDRVVWVSEAAQADYRVADDGSLQRP
ncbi:hypothetical protein [Arenimonas alkanexedens]